MSLQIFGIYVDRVVVKSGGPIQVASGPQHFRLRANLYIGLEKFKAADEDLDPILRSTPNNFMANYLRALELDKQQKYTAADQIFNRIDPVFPRFWAGYYLQGATQDHRRLSSRTCRHGVSGSATRAPEPANAVRSAVID